MAGQEKRETLEAISRFGLEHRTGDAPDAALAKAAKDEEEARTEEACVRPPRAPLPQKIIPKTLHRNSQHLGCIRSALAIL